MINIDPNIETVPLQNEEPNQDPEEQDSKKNNYTIFVNLPNLKIKKEIKLRKEATLEDAISAVINLDDPKFKDLTINDLEVYLASENGEPDEDCPAIEKSQVILHVNFARFVLRLKNDDEFCEEEREEEEMESFCFCFKRKKEEDVYMKIE